MFNAAAFLFRGKGGQTVDYKKALECLSKVAEQKPFVKVFDRTIRPNCGVFEAECLIGDSYRDGIGIGKNKTEAFEWYKKLARYGYSSGQHNVAVALFNGIGCQKDFKAARHWFQKASDNGLAPAQLNYDKLLMSGIDGHHPDTEKAEIYLKMAADQGRPEANGFLQELAKGGTFGSAGKERVKRYIQEKCKEKDPASLLLLGCNHGKGEGEFEKNLELAEKFLREVAEKNHPRANFALSAVLTKAGKYEEAFTYAERAALDEGSAGSGNTTLAYCWRTVTDVLKT